MLIALKKLRFIAVIILIGFHALAFASVKAVIFDCDGVLVDTEYLKFEAWRDALSQHKINFTIDDYLPLVGHSSEKIAAEIEKSKKVYFDAKAVIAEKNTFYKKQQAKGVPPIKDAVSFLKNVLKNKKKYGIKVGLASSASHVEIDRNLKSIGINPNDFDAIASGDDDLKHIVDKEGTNKPKPYIYQLIAKELDVNPKDCVVFEDTNAGVEAASTAGMTVFAVPNQFTDKQDFKKAAGVLSSLSKFDINIILSDRLVKKYNIALVPEQKNYSLYVEFSERNFKNLSTGYLLGKKSLPHISLCQFECQPDNPDLIEIFKLIKSSMNQPIYPEFQSLNIVALQGVFKGQLAADIGVARHDEILGLQNTCIAILNKYHLTPLNLVGNLYRPHLTLAFFNPQPSLMLSQIPSELLSKSKHPFYVNLGEADKNWQYVRILDLK